MKPEEISGFIRDGGEDTLSMEALIELIKAVTEKGTSLRFQAPGLSMYPFIRDSDYITISPLNTCHPQLGDVVAFILPGTGRLIVHRIVENKGSFYLVKGDNTPEPDGLIPKANVLGYVTKVEENRKKTRFGLGVERILIAHMSHRNQLIPTLSLAWRFIGPIIRRIKT